MGAFQQTAPINQISGTISQVLPTVQQNNLQHEKNRDLLKAWKNRRRRENLKGDKKNTQVIIQADIEIKRLSNYFDRNKNRIFSQTKQQVSQEKKLMQNNTLTHAQKMLLKVQARDYPNRDAEIKKWHKIVRAEGNTQAIKRKGPSTGMKQINSSKEKTIKKDAVIEKNNNLDNLDRQIQLAKTRGERYAYGILSKRKYLNGLNTDSLYPLERQELYNNLDKRIFELETELVKKIKTSRLANALINQFRNAQDDNILDYGNMDYLRELSENYLEKIEDKKIADDWEKTKREIAKLEKERQSIPTEEVQHPIFDNFIVKKLKK